LGYYLLTRFIQSAVVLVILSVVIYALMYAMPGDPITESLQARPGVTAEDIVRLKKHYGFDQPFIVRYGKWVGRVVQGDLEYSRIYFIPTSELIKQRLGNTLKLTLAAFALSFCIAIPLGVICAVKQYSPFDYTINTLAFIGISIPSFWLGIMFILIFAEKLQWLPAGNMSTPGVDSIFDRSKYLIMPAFVLAIQSIAGWTRYMRGSMLEVIRLDYVRTARAKGLSDGNVIFKHALRNAFIPIVTLMALSLPGLFGGAVITETIFSWNGMGKLIIESVRGSDYYVAMATLLMLAALTLFFNFVADMMYAVVDPRIKAHGKR
jgi:peptide/nickel transport system permease protein